MRALVALGFVLALLATGCHGPDCSCALTGAFIHSPAGDLVSASGCGTSSTTCRPSSPCDLLSVAPPPDGGKCTVTIVFADGTSTDVVADFGAMHPSNDCCGPYYDNGEFGITVHGDAGAADASSD